MTWDVFLFNLAASLISGVMLIFAVALISRSARWVLTGVLGRFLRVDIDYVFADSAEALKDLAAEIARARDVAILAGRGHDLQLEPFAPLFQRRPRHSAANVRVLLPSTAPQSNAFDWTAQREDELAAFDPAFGSGLLKKQIDMSAEFVRGHVGPFAQLRRYEAPHLGRMIITDRVAYFTPYRSGAHGRSSEVVKLRRGELYDGLARFFELVWAASPEDPAPRGDRGEITVQSGGNRR